MAVVTALSVASIPALAHEQREIGSYQFVVGFMEEPLLRDHKTQ